VSWDDPRSPSPLYATLTPQEAIERHLPQPGECDLTIVILWSRMGTPLTEPRKADGSQYQSGTEYEFENARAAGKPVLLYRRLDKPQLDIDDPDIAEKQRQWGLVKTFFERFRHLDGSLAGGFKTYNRIDEFKAQLESDIRHELQRRLVKSPAGRKGAAGRRARSGRSKGGAAGVPAVPPAYREWLRSRLTSIELLGLRLKQGTAVRLGHVYVPLMTSSARTIAESKDAEAVRFEREYPMLLMERLDTESLFVSGQAGSGKSTFCRWAALAACEGRLPAHEGEAREYREAFPESFTGKLPVLLRLRDLAEMLPDTPGRSDLTKHELEVAVGRWVDNRQPEGLNARTLQAHVEAGSALLIFDGVDEVPTSAGPEGRERHPRAMLVAGLADARKAWTDRGNRLLVTSRPYGLEPSEVTTLGLPEAAILDLTPQLQALLARRWFRILIDQLDDAEATASRLLVDVGERDWLQPLASNPLLLTAMCVIYGQGKRLPQDKYELFDRIVDTVLHNRIEGPTRIGIVRTRLSVVAHLMHLGDGADEPHATPRATATHREVERCIQRYQEGSPFTETGYLGPLSAREELLSKTGLLLPRDLDRAEFYHLSIQDFLAASRLHDVEPDLARFIAARSATPEWRNTLSFLFGAVVGTASSPERGARLLSSLVRVATRQTVGLLAVIADCLDILRGRGVQLAGAELDVPRRECLVAIRSHAPALDRVRLGDVLARLGDPRFRADAWHLPDDELLGFVEIPAGVFRMGSDPWDEGSYRVEQPSHYVDVERYFIARWPVTVAQFRVFAEESHYLDGKGRSVAGHLHEADNHPVFVSHHAALGYCSWLTKKLRSWQQTPAALAYVLSGNEGPGWEVTLPTEAEWEKAARGVDGPSYPWGEDPDPDCANYLDTGIGEVCAVGCFPRGASVYGVEELSGNTAEWTRSYFDLYPVEAEGSAREFARIVVRGGYPGYDARDTRATFRSTVDAGKGSAGFRTVVSRLPVNADQQDSDRHRQ
jgi:formylglycine-generating enzyme required for sulfatase activity